MPILVGDLAYIHPFFGPFSIANSFKWEGKNMPYFVISKIFQKWKLNSTYFIIYWTTSWHQEGGGIHLRSGINCSYFPRKTFLKMLPCIPSKQSFLCLWINTVQMHPKLKQSIMNNLETLLPPISRGQISCNRGPTSGIGPLLNSACKII